MKRTIQVVFIIGFLLCCWAKLRGFPYPYSRGEPRIIPISKFPITDAFTNKRGWHFDLGLYYRQTTVFLLPVWNYELRWCGYYPDDADYYLTFTADQIKHLTRLAEVDLPDPPLLSIPIWEAYGGKLVLVAMLIMMGRIWRWTNEIEYVARSESEEIMPPPTSYASAPKRTPIAFASSALVPAEPLPDLKGSCVYCGQKLAFSPTMLNTIISCPACKRSTRLRSANLGTS